MNRLLKEVFEHAETWPQEDQEELAEYAREIEARRTGIYTMPTNARQSGRDWLKPIAESLCRKNSLLKPISATGESPLHASGVL